MDQVNMKIVDFEHYCPTCEFSNIADVEDPCNDCLTVPAREYSHKPEKYQEKETRN